MAHPPAAVSRQNGAKGGRKLVPSTHLSRALAAEIIRSGNAPLHIMLDNMLFHHSGALEIRDALDTIVAQVQQTRQYAGVLTEAQLAVYERALDLMSAYKASRNKSQECAKDAAPYVHPRLSSVAVTPGDIDPDLTTDVSDDMLTEIVVQVRQQLVRGGDRKMIDVSPKRR